MSWIKTLTIQIIVFFSLFGLVEFSITLFYNKPESYSLESFIKSIPEPFKEDNEFNIIVKNFNGECQFPAMLHKDGLTTYANDFSCGGVTYKDGKRLTLPGGGNYNLTIHVFGGSTVWGTGAVDHQTIPSLLASSLTTQNVRVLNYGIPSFVASQQNNHLKAFLTEVLPGDIVLYYDGGNDFWNGVMMGNAGGNIVGYNVENRFDVYVYTIKNWMSKNLKTYQLLSDLRHGRKDQNINTCSVTYESASNKISEAAHFYATAISEARFISESKGVKFYHFFQPTLFDVDELSEYEKNVILHDPCWLVARQMKEEYDKIFLSKSPLSVDFSEKLNNKNLFFDYIHVSGRGNKLIASEILRELGFF